MGKFGNFEEKSVMKEIRGVFDSWTFASIGWGHDISSQGISRLYVRHRLLEEFGQCGVREY